MMAQNNYKGERRRFTRVKDAVPIKIKERDLFLFVQTKDLSSSGVYCQTFEPIPPLSRVNVTLLMPHSSRFKKRVLKIECGGIIVRCHRAKPSPGRTEPVYDIAIYFDELVSKDRNSLDEYVKYVLAKKKNPGN